MGRQLLQRYRYLLINRRENTRMDPSKMSHEELMEAFMDKIAYVDEGDIVDDDDYETQVEFSDEEMRAFLKGKL